MVMIFRLTIKEIYFPTLHITFQQRLLRFLLLVIKVIVAGRYDDCELEALNLEFFCPPYAIAFTALIFIQVSGWR